VRKQSAVIDLIDCTKNGNGILSGKSSKIDFKKYALDPVGFIEKDLKENLTAEQKAIAQSVVENRETNVQACHGSGKSFLSARLVIWWVFCVGGLAITTAPTARQVNKILWGEIRKVYDKRRKKLGGERGVLFLRVDESAHAFGFTAKHTSSDAFQGIHSDRLLIVIDESSGISEEIDSGAQSCVTGAHNRLLRIGNPLRKGTPFYKACVRSHIRIPAWNHPNVSWAYTATGRLKPEVAKWILDPKGEVLSQDRWAEAYRDRIPGAVSVQWIEEARTRYGENSPFWMARVEGLFPADDVEGIVPLSWLLEARRRYDDNPDYWDNLAATYDWRLGGDVGDGGDDHGLALWRGPVLYKVATYATKGDREDVTRFARVLAKEASSLGGAVQIAIDRTGVGAGTLASLLESGHLATGCSFGASAENKAQYKDRKTELYWEFRESLRRGEMAIAPLGEIEERLFEDLSSIRYQLLTSGQIKTEEKPKTRARIKRSPDAGDAAIIATENPWRLRESVAGKVLNNEIEQVAADDVTLDEIVDLFSKNMKG